MRILLFDNYDSFTYNLLHLVQEVDAGIEVDVIKNDQISPEEALVYDRIILSPGPGIPSEAGNLIPLIKAAAGRLKILGVCLGHQAIAEAFGGSLINLESVYHGVAKECRPLHDDVQLFAGLKETFPVGRYHSWIVDESSLPAELEVTARDEEGYIMAMRHKKFDITGVQFHPESVLTPDGRTMMKNWLAE